MLPETEGPMRGWLRGQPAIAALVGARVYFAVPEQDRPELPFIVFHRVGGLPDDTQHDHPDFIVECWGSNKHEASTLATTVASRVMDATHEGPSAYEGVKVEACRSSGPIMAPGLTWAKRYRVDVSMRMH